MVSDRMQKLADRRNLAAVRGVIRRIKVISNASGKVLTIGAYSARARRLLDSLKNKAEDARLFISSNDERLRRGEIDRETASAEAATARTLLLLYFFLEKSYLRSCELGEVEAMRRIRTSADLLYTFAYDKEYRQGIYPKDEKELAAHMRGCKFQEAQTLRESIVSELGDVPSRLGLEVPGDSHHSE